MEFDVYQSLNQLGLQLPPAPKAQAAYLPAVAWEGLVVTAGQLPLEGGKLRFSGVVGAELSLEEGYQAARLCALNCLAVVQDLVGDLNRVARVLKVTGYVRSAPGFTEQPRVLNGASELLALVFGPVGQHARTAVGVSELPLGAAVEVALVVALRQ